MTRIKIISNPYQKKISYQHWDESSQRWNLIDFENHSNSKLISEELTTSFFPFKVKEIVDVIIDEYSIVNEKLQIEFEGTDDEYRELEAVCKDKHYQDLVELSKSDRFLENARDILPDIIEIFKSLNPLVSQSVKDREKIEKELEKFSDASNDVIPICVVGNYSAGKSTFINALIGNEILPSGDEPITAKIYKIRQSKQMDRASVKFEYENHPIILRFMEDDYRYGTGLLSNPLTDELSKKLGEMESKSLDTMLSKVLAIINNFENQTGEDKVSDLVEITVPFVSGLWRETQSDFVIFDTPGSNSASNDKHLKILKRAMEGFTNGLPVFVCEYNSLDSTDNEKLYREIADIKELDNRFTPLYNFLKEMPYEALWCIISLPTKTHERSDLIRQPYYTTTNT